MKRTQALEILDKANTAYEVCEFEATDFTAEEAAEKLALPLDMVFKTLLVRGERRGIVMALVPGDAQLSLSKLARAMSDKRAELVDAADLFRLTGYLKGGCSPLGARRAFPVYMDETAVLHDRICVSAGRRGVQMLLAPSDLQRITGATLADLCDR